MWLHTTFSETDVYSLDIDGILLPIIYLLSVGVLCITLCLMLDTKILLSWWYMVRERMLTSPVPQSQAIQLDSDVVAERTCVAPMSVAKMKQYSLVTKDLSKMYRNFCSVNRLSFTVEASV